MLALKFLVKEASVQPKTFFHMSILLSKKELRYEYEFFR